MVPKYYVGGRRCKWTLRSDPGQRIQLRFLDISLREEVSQSSHPQCADSIRVTERGRNLLSMCGESKQDIVLLSDANKLEASLIPGVPSPELRFGLGFNVYYVVLHLGP